MKIRNLFDYPAQLGDGRMLGAKGTREAEREYQLPELSKEDKRRVKRGQIEIVEEPPVAPPKSDSDATGKTNNGGKK